MLESSKSMSFWLRLLILTVILYIAFAVSGLLLGLGESPPGESQLTVSLFTLIVCLLHAGILSHLIVRSKWRGWQLTVTIFLIYYGIMTFLSQIETVVFLKYLADIVAAEDLPALFGQGLIVAGLFSPVAVALHGKLKTQEVEGKSPVTLGLTWDEWLKKLSLIAVVYVVIYIGFGALLFRPLVGEAFQEYYGDIGLPPWILLLQVARAFIWAAIAVPIVRMFKGRPWEINLAIALSFSIIMGTLLLIPTSIMPTSIRLGHFAEVTLSNFIFGWLVGAILQQPSKARPGGASH
ncbi:MAG: hypothetical protein GX354_03395 [Firmicutes bacterium]|jgi:hypothetical protein|nr:hypothetical protein [Bacillota bacterium]